MKLKIIKAVGFNDLTYAIAEEPDVARRSVWMGSTWGKTSLEWTRLADPNYSSAHAHVSENMNLSHAEMFWNVLPVDLYLHQHFDDEGRLDQTRLYLIDSEGARWHLDRDSWQLLEGIET